MAAASDPYIAQLAGTVWSFLNSEFVSALLGALAGALAGAYGGARIVERQSVRKRQLEQVRETNVAISLVLFVLNTTLQLKRQHFQKMIEVHKIDRERFDEIARQKGNRTFEFKADWETLPLTELPLQPLREIIYARIDAPAPTISLFAMLVAVSGHLHATVTQRNEFITALQQGPQLTPKQRLDLYFGLRQQDGTTDARYPSMLTAISGYADAAILFSAVLAERLIEHAQAEAAKLGKGAPRVTEMDLKAAFAAGLVPDPEEYAEALKGVSIDALAALGKYR